MPLATQASFVGLGKETTRGTAVTPSLYLPIHNLAPHDILHYINDESNRGSMVDMYGQQPAQANGEYDFQGDVFPDTTGNILMGILGNSAVATGAVFTDVVLSGTAGSVVTATSVSANFTSADVGKTVTVSGGTGGVGTTATITAVTSLTVATVTASVGTPTNGSPASFTIVRTTTYTHTLGLLNNSGATGNQPPSYTVSDYTGINTRAFANAMFSELALSYSAAEFLKYSSKAVTNKSVIVSSPTSSYSAFVPIVAWNGQCIIAGALQISGLPCA